jgi:folate-dependent phosphoribosylglycinamide formyltransferase PurN
VRVVVIASSVYSETACAMCVRLAQTGCVPAGVLALRFLNRKTLLRKVGQWGFRSAVAYARSKLIRGESGTHVRNPYLEQLLANGDEVFRSLREVGRAYRFPVATCSDQNSLHSLALLQRWSPDIIVFTGGNILRAPLLDVPRLGVINAHLGLLPEMRGMSSPEWSLLNHVPVGVAVHYIDEGIDTGPVLQQFELPDAARFESLPELRNRLIAFAVDKMAAVVAALTQGTISAFPQTQRDRDNQCFVMHERLQALAAQRLRRRTRFAAIAGAAHA